MPPDVQIIICDMLTWVCAGLIAVPLLLIICRRIWQMREAELELKEIKKRMKKGSHNGY